MRRALPLLLAAALVFVAAGSAAGVKRAVSTTIIVSPRSSNTLVAGELRSPHGFCLRDRPVALKRRIGNGATLEGRDRTDGEGQFEIEGAFVSSNEYFVTTPARTVTVGGRHRQCEGARSARFAIH